MRGNELLDKMALVDFSYVEAAEKQPVRRKSSLKIWCAAAACLCLVFSLAIPVMAASVPAFYNMLYEISPATAQFFRPVQLSCEDNGIRMEAVAAYLHEDTAEIFVSLQDLEQARIDETIDLFDSYQIHTPFDCTGHCQLSGYDPDTHTAVFLITLEAYGLRQAEGDKLTFSIRKFLAHKKTFTGVMDAVPLNRMDLTTATQTVEPSGLGGTALHEAYRNSAEGTLTVLKPGGSLYSPLPGILLTGIGYAEGRLHVQMYYENTSETDNHGFVSLMDGKTGKAIPAYGSIAFPDDARKGSYVDYVFTGIPMDAPGDYQLYGDFTASAGSVEGNWSVTFPLKNIVDETNRAGEN